MTEKSHPLDFGSVEERQVAAPGGASAAAIWAAATVTALDGFDAFSMSLAAPRMISELGIATSSLGPVFASTMGGMIVGASLGGILADRVGRLRILIASLAVFGLATLALTTVSSAGGIVANRLVTGIGLGAAAPVAVALLNGSGVRPPSDWIISVVWAGLALGGILAAVFNYLAVPAYGWRSIFVVGGLLPFAAAVFAYAVFRNQGAAVAGRANGPSPGIAGLFAADAVRPTVGTALMFFFGYVTTSVVVNWLPTVLSHAMATPLLVSGTFAGINIGSAVGTLGLGYLSSRLASPRILAAAWFTAGLCALCAVLPGLDLLWLSVLLIAAATVAAGSQALSVAFANRLHRHRGLQSTSVGLMVSAGRVGQFGALSFSGLLLSLGLPERGLFAFAGLSAFAAAGIATLVVRRTELP